MTVGISITQVDAFTAKPFEGNPAAVCFLPEARDEKWMQLVAREMNLSDTAFVVRRGDGAFDLRWFTPAAEVELCGHATLASAHTLWESGMLPPGEKAKFHTRSGLLTAEKKGEWIELDFPVVPVEPTEVLHELESALGVKAKWMGRARSNYLVETERDEDVRNAKPDFGAIGEIAEHGVIITSRGEGSDYDFVSRFFAPAVGVNEDPVCGSAHCSLAPFWSGRLGRESLTGYQASARGGFVRTRLAGDRVVLSGQAVTVLRCELV